MRARHTTASGLEVVTEAHMDMHHKLTKEQRKQRRQDNKAMKRARKLLRKRRKHGRNR